jgi:hypothetical protein
VTTLIPRLYAVDKATQALTPLDGWEKLELSPVRNEAGSITVAMDSGAPGFATLFAGIDAAGNRDVEVEIHITGSASKRFRGLLQEKAGDEVAPGQSWTFAGGDLGQLLAEALVVKGSGSPYNAKGELAFAAVSPGAVLITATQQAQTRTGVMAGVSWDFTASVDSAGVAWASSLTDLAFAPGTSLQQIAAKLEELQVAEFEVSAGRVLRAWNYGGRGVDRTSGDTPLRFAEAVNLGKASRRESSRTPASGTAVLVKGADGFYGYAADASAQAARGRRVEVAVDAGQISSQAGVPLSSCLTAAASTALLIKKIGTAGYEYQVALGAGLPAPGVDFEVGDYAYAAVGQTFVKRRISQWVLTFERGKPPAAVVALNDLVLDPLVALYRKLTAISSGGAVVGTSTNPDGTGPDTLAPNPPTGVTANSSAYLDGPYTLAAVTVGWTPPSTNTDGSPLSDLDGYRVQVRYASDPGGAWQPVVESKGATSSVTFEATPGAVISIRVAAYDTSGNFSAWASLSGTHTVAAYVVKPPTPSTPTAADYLGTLIAKWDGLDSAGAAMPLVVRVNGYVEVHMSTSNTFTPVAPTPSVPGATFQGRLYGPGPWAVSDLSYGTARFFKLVAVDGAGNRSDPSAASGAATPTQAGDLDIGAINVGKLTSGNLSAAVTLTGSILAGTPGAGRVEQDSGGIRIYSPANVQIGLLGTAGYNWLLGELRTAVSGTRLVINPNGTDQDRINFYPSSGTSAAYLYTYSVAGQANLIGRGNSIRSDGKAGEFGAWPVEGYVRWVAAGATNPNSSATARETEVLVEGPSIKFQRRDQYANDGGTKRMEFLARDTSNVVINASVLYLQSASANEPWFQAPAENSGIGFATNTMTSLQNGGSFGAMCASQYNCASSVEVKTAFRELAATGRSGRDLLDGAPTRLYKYKADLDVEQAWPLRPGGWADEHELQWHGAPFVAPWHIGPMAEDLPEWMLGRVTAGNGVEHVVVNIDDKVGLLWQVCREQDQELRALRGRVDQLVGPTAHPVVDGEVA